MVIVTDTAAEKALLLLEQSAEDNLDEGKEHGLRMKVVGGGCSGFQYELGFDEQKSNDKIAEHNGLKVLIKLVNMRSKTIIELFNEITILTEQQLIHWKHTVDFLIVV